MSFLETMFAQAADGELDVPAGGDDHATYDVPPGVLGMPLHNPTSYLLSMRTKAGSNERKFPREYAKHVDAVALSKGVGHTLVRVLGPMKFVVQKHFTGRQFTVKVGDGRSCTCPECNLDASALVNEKANRICSATLFVLLKVLQIPKESPLIFRKVWREDEIKRVLQSKGEQRGLVLEQNHHQPFSPEVLEAQPELRYEDEYDRRYGYHSGFSERDLRVMGGTYGLDASVKKGAVFTAKDMRNLAVAKEASHMASYDGSRGDGIRAMKSVDEMHVPRKNRVFSKLRDEEVGRGSYESVVSGGGRSGGGMCVGSPGTLPDLSIRLPSRMSSVFSDDFSKEDDAASRTTTASTVASTVDSFDVEYPFYINGGRKVVAQGCILAPGVKIRHPALLHSKRFVKQIKEFLYVWDTTKGKKDKAFLAKNIRTLWVQNSMFKIWASNVHQRNLDRAAKLKTARIRLSVVMQNGATVGVCVSPLVTGREVCFASLKKRQMVNYHVRKRGKEMCLLFMGDYIDGRRTMLDAGISDRSTLCMTFDTLTVNRKTRNGVV